MRIAATESASLCEADELLTAFLELESAILRLRRFFLTSRRDFSKLGVAKRI
jgi:hypothetical protein